MSALAPPAYRLRSRRAIALTAAALTLISGCTPTAPAPEASSSSAAVPAPPGTTASAPPAAVRAMARSLPERLRIPLIGVDTDVMSLGLLADGEVAVPPIAAHAPAGWYDGSPTPGQTGPSVILGHVTVGRYGDGVFKQLPRLRAGDRVSVTRMDGSVATFAVDSVQTVAKTRFPTQRVYGNVDHPALRLITCGGTRVGAAGGYSDNVIVYASLVAAS
ncbi:class F sortase [Streptomyces sp. NBC_01527]|uniref:class F sortase n=1 Tax=Streptomyces sp. NBC_01527 TaxID=2903894 RepID=UPI00386B13A8